MAAPPSPQPDAQKLSTAASTRSAASEAIRFYEFGPFRLDVRRQRLLRDGEPIAIKRKALETLLVLIEHRGQVVEKDELMARLWPDTIVEEANLTQNVFVVRKALGEASGDQRYIATVARRGYRFVADVRAITDGRVTAVREDTAVPPGRHGRPGAIAALALVLVLGLGAMVAWQVLSETESSGPVDGIAVLPFRSLSDDPEQEYFADGMTDAVISDLAAVSSLRVVSRQSSMAYKDSRRRLPDIARELGVAAVVEGTVVRSADRVRLTVRLVDAHTDRSVWTDSFDRHAGDVLALQGDLARAIAERVQARITADERDALAERRQVDPEVYDLYLRGRYLWERRTEESFGQSLEYYRQAIERDPAFAPAYAGIALAYATSSYLGFLPGSQAGPRIREAAAQALAIDPNLVDGHVAEASLAVLYDWDWERAEQAWRRILERQPNNANARLWYGFLLEQLGRLEESVEQRRWAVRSNPLSPTINGALASTLWSLGHHDEAMRWWRRTVDLNPRAAGLRVWLGLMYLREGRRDEALAEIEAAAAADAMSPALGHVYGLLGRSEDARRILGALEQRSRERYVPPLYFAHVLAGLGNLDAAFARLEDAYEERSPNLVGLPADAYLEPLRADPRFEQMVRRMKLPWPGAPTSTARAPRTSSSRAASTPR